MFLSNLLLLIVPIIAILIIGIPYSQFFLKGFLSEEVITLLESGVLGPITTFFRYAVIFLVAVFVAVNLFITRSMAKTVAAYNETQKELSIYEKNLGEKISIGDLHIFTKAYRVFIKEEEIKFAGKEFELLLFLASNPNIVFSKDKLFESVWGYDLVGDSETVTVHINRIRKKIETDGSELKYIETVWGAGYRFNK
jgi:DNA-binding winged helix-turn-helix (wHTH) protein